MQGENGSLEDSTNRREETLDECEIRDSLPLGSNIPKVSLKQDEKTSLVAKQDSDNEMVELPMEIIKSSRAQERDVIEKSAGQARTLAQH